MTESPTPLRLFYAAGPGNVIQTYHYWKKGEEDPSVLGITDSSQFYDLATELNAQSLVIAYCQPKEKLKEGLFTLLHLPKKHFNGIFYHFYQIYYGIKLCFAALKFKANVAIIEEGMSHWFVWNILYFFGVRVIPSLKCTLWLEFEPLAKKQKVINWLDSGFFKRASSILSISQVISRQIEKLNHDQIQKIIPFVSVYNPRLFKNIPPPEPLKKPFNILFVGRIIEFKGVFDLVEIAKKLKENQVDDIHFHFCGTGPDEKELKQKIVANGLEKTCFYEGYCTHQKLIEMYGIAHVVIVPTRTTFLEGLPNVLVEGILANRPVVTSKVCPALITILPAAVEVTPNDIEGYYKAIVRLYSDPEFYRHKQSACSDLQQQFYDPNNSFNAALRHAIQLIES